MSRSKFTNWLVGSSTDVLKEDFISACLSDKEIDIKSWLPFSGKLQLPTKLEVLKLFIPQRWGRTNMSILDPSTLLLLILSRNIGTGDMAGFETIHWINQEVKLVLDEYQVQRVKISSGENRQELMNLHTILRRRKTSSEETTESWLRS